MLGRLRNSAVLSASLFRPLAPGSAARGSTRVRHYILQGAEISGTVHRSPIHGRRRNRAVLPASLSLPLALGSAQIYALKPCKGQCLCSGSLHMYDGQAFAQFKFHARAVRARLNYLGQNCCRGSPVTGPADTAKGSLLNMEAPETHSRPAPSPAQPAQRSAGGGSPGCRRPP